MLYFIAVCLMNQFKFWQNLTLRHLLNSSLKQIQDLLDWKKWKIHNWLRNRGSLPKWPHNVPWHKLWNNRNHVKRKTPTVVMFFGQAFDCFKSVFERRKYSNLFKEQNIWERTSTQLQIWRWLYIAMSKKSTTTPPKYRDAGTGQYVPKKYADKHPKTTVKETDKKK